MARRLVATAICVLVLGATAPVRSETDLIVDGNYCGRLAQLLWKKRQVHALECTTTSGPVASPVPAPSKLFLGDTMVGYVCDLARGRDLQGLDCKPRFGEPGTERLPTPTPKPRLGWLMDWLIPSAHAADLGVWWPASGWWSEEAYGMAFSPVRQADREWFCGTRGCLDDSRAEELTRFLGRNSGNPKARQARFYVGETGTHWWCMDAMRSGGLGRDAASLPDPLGSDSRRSRDLKRWGATSLLTAPYVFGCKHALDGESQRLLHQELGVPLPSGYVYRPIWPQPTQAGCHPDYPDGVSVRLDSACFDRWLDALKAQHPEVDRVTVQTSNGCNAYGFDSRGYSIAGRTARSLKRHGFPATLQLEDRNCQREGVTSFWEASPSADCAMLRAIRKAKAQPSIFWGWSLPEIADDLEACE